MPQQIVSLHPASPPDVYVHVGQRLRALRQERGLTQAQAARIIEVSPQQYQKYEDAQSKCNLTYLMALADHYGVHVNAFLPVEAPEVSRPASEDRMASEADLLARLVSSFVKLSDVGEKLRLVQLVEAIVEAQKKSAREGVR